MTECIIENGFVVDDVESVVTRIKELSKATISDIETVKRFILKEKNTKFYIDSKLNTQMQKDNNSVYVWLDTGYVDMHGNPIFISLLKGAAGFVGHVVGTIIELSNNVKNYFRLSYDAVKQKIQTFKNKYEKKSCERSIKHIREEKQYIMQAMNDESHVSQLAMKIQALGLLEEVVEEPEEVEPVVVEETFSEREEKITIGLLLERLDGMSEYIQELLGIIAKGEKELQIKDEKFKELQKQNDEYVRALLSIRDFTDKESVKESKECPEHYGHELLGNHNKILVIGGGELGSHIMQGIAKELGFEKKDFELVEYDKANDFADRIRRNGKYGAIIFGACPHKTSANARYASLLEKLRNTEGMPYVADARTTSGVLKVTKESFRNSLVQVYEYLRKMAKAS